MHKSRNKIKHVIFGLGCMFLLAGAVGCSKEASESLEVNELEEQELENNPVEDSLDVPEDTSSEELVEEETPVATEESEDSQLEEVEEILEEKKVDLIIFAGQSNMSGCGGDASLAPEVSEEAGMEFRAVSDPTKLYKISEPFGANENNLSGLFEKPGGKKGSLVSAFINEYYSRTNTQVIAVSASRGETAMSQWLDASIQNDVVSRLIVSKDWLEYNGYTINHIYMVWLQGESDALKRVSQDTYKTDLDNFVRPLFASGLEKVFIITPGRTIDEKEIYSNVVNAQLTVSKESPYYALATNALSSVSTEYMTDIYHYNQHVLNMLGKFSAESVAYYTLNGREMTTYDYKNMNLFVPEDGDGQMPEDIILDLYSININESY